MCSEFQRQSMSGADFAPVNAGIAFRDIRMPEKITAVMAAKKRNSSRVCGTAVAEIL
jgi:hypothetical protein